MAFVFIVVTLLVVEITKRASPMFKRHPFKSVEHDLEGAFSFFPYFVLHNENISPYIHCNIKEFGNANMLSLYNKHMMDGMGNLKPKFKTLQEMGFI